MLRAVSLTHVGMGCDWQTTICRTKHISCPTARQGEIYFCLNRTRIIWNNNFTRQTNIARARVYIPLFPSRLWSTLLELQPEYSRNNYASHKFQDVHSERLIFSLVDVLMLKSINIGDPCAYSKIHHKRHETSEEEQLRILNHTCRLSLLWSMLDVFILHHLPHLIPMCHLPHVLPVVCDQFTYDNLTNNKEITVRLIRD